MSSYNSDNSEIVKPSNDHKEYRRVVLDNGLVCLLVFDNKTDKSSAGLTVLTGSYDDPDDLMGLAHFLEHMLFMGSEKYPGQNEYSDFIESNGGSSNAYTSDNSTFYYFDIPNENFEKGLDIFGQFFISPLFTRDLVDREMCAVNSEYMIDLQSDSWRFNMLQRFVSNPSHPYHKFGIGNLETLKTEKTVERLIEFYNTNYSSDIMYLVVVANQSLDHSERMVREVFDSVPNKHLKLDTTHRVHRSNSPIDSIESIYANYSKKQSTPNPFDSPYSNRLVYTRPIKDANKLLICYQLPALSSLYKIKPDDTLAHLIGHEGPGSILECMKRLGLAESLCAGAEHGINTFTMFKVSISLTKKGFDNIPECIQMVTQYIEMLKKTGCDKTMCNEQRHLNALRFDQLDHEEAVEQVETLSNDIVMYGDADVLSGGYLIDEPTDESVRLINHILKENFCPENRNIYIISQTFPHKLFGREQDDWDEIKQKEPWLRSEYYATLCAATIDNTTKDYGFHIPKPNPFIPENLNILPLKPILIEKDSQHEVWYKPDTKFNKPVCYLDQMMYSPYIQSDPYTCAVMTGIVMEELNSYTYDASLADLHFSISTREKQMILIHCSGYSDKFMTLLNRVIDQLFAKYDGPTDELQVLFNTVKDKLLRKLKNKKLANVREQISETFHNISNERYIEVDREIELLNAVTLESVILFKATWHQTMYSKYLVQGNCYENMILEHVNNMSQKVKYSSIPYLPRAAKMISNRDITVVIRSNDPDNVCSGLMRYHVVDNIDLEKLASLKILGHLISEPFFNQLRTNEQLGYDVYGDMYPIGRMYGLCLRVISDTKDPEYLCERVELFMKSMEDRLTTISTDQYEENLQGIITNILDIDTKLSDEFDRNSREIMLGRYAFHSREHLAEQIKKTQLDQVINLYRQIISVPNSLTVMAYTMNRTVDESIPQLEFSDVPFVFKSMI